MTLWGLCSYGGDYVQSILCVTKAGEGEGSIVLIGLQVGRGEYGTGLRNGVRGL